MSSLPLKASIILLLATTLAASSSSKSVRRNEQPIADNRAAVNVISTTFTKSHTIDWVSIDSQGVIAQAPPPRTPRDGARPLAELELPGAELGPLGTVPIPRAKSISRSKQLPGMPSLKRQDSQQGMHWYVTSNQSVANLGGSCVFSLFAPYTQNTADSSLLQTAVVKDNVLVTGFRGLPIVVPQTVEAGWINFIDQVAQPHLFTFYTTNGYLQDGDNQGGWNTEFTGWVQVDQTIHPGSVFTPLSVIGGAQQNLHVEYLLFQDNWWLAVEERWIGYYPASLFSNVSSDPASTTLAGGSDDIRFYGEVYNSETTLTTTDMGSGEFASAGYGRAGYILNMTYRDIQNISRPYNGVFNDTAPDRYTHEAHLLSGTSMGSYALIGGPGAGGHVGS